MSFFDHVRKDFPYPLVVSILGSLFFSVFNGVMGLVCHTIWNSSICFYFVLLTILRGTLLRLVVREKSSKRDDGSPRKTCFLIHWALLVANILLVGPIYLMVSGERNYSFGLIPAIALAAYAVFRVTNTIRQFRKSRMQDNPFLKEFMLINLEDALVSLLTLQNALIIANGDSMRQMIPFTSMSSAGIWLMIVILTVRFFFYLASRSE